MKFFKVFILVNLVICITIKAELVNEISTYQKTETICDMEFVYRKKIVNGKTKLKWFINNHEVDKEEYLENYLRQKEKELENELEKYNEQESEQEQFKIEVQINLLKKLLTLKIKDIKEVLKKINELSDRNLDNYFNYDSDTLQNIHDLNNIEKIIIPDIENCLEDIDYKDKMSIEKLNGNLKKIENYPNKLTIFFKSTINNAIQHCDDTKLLRNLLDLMN